MISTTAQENGSLLPTQRTEEQDLLRRVYQLIDDSKQQQIRSRENLNKIISENKHLLSIQLENLNDIQNQVGLTEKRAIHLGKTISNTFKLAEGVSYKVRQLHGIQERVQLAIDAVEASIGMKSCVEGVEEAIKTGDYERATEYVSRVLHINNDSHRSKLLMQLNQAQNSEEKETEDEQERRNTMFKKAEKKIKEIVRQKMKEALKDDVDSQIIRFSSLFAPLCMEEEGLVMYTQYLAEKARNELDSLVHDSLDKIADLPIDINTIEDDEERYMTIRKQQQQGYTSFIDVVTQVLDIVVSYIEEYEEFIVTNFGGSKAVIYLMNALQTVCDKMISKIMTVYEKKRDLTDRLTLITSKNNSTKKDNRARPSSPFESMKSASPSIASDDPRVLDLILNEIAEISTTIEVYRQFTLSKAFENKQENVDSKYMMNKDAAIYRKMQEIMSYYIPFDESFMKQSFAKAIQYNQVSPKQSSGNSAEPKSQDFFEESDEEEESSDEEDEDESSKYSPIINDAFFIFQKSMNRAIDSQNIPVICAITNHIVSILTGEYFELMRRDLSLISLNPSSNKDNFVKILVSCEKLQLTQYRNL